jgi:uncharacterized protein YkwD
VSALVVKSLTAVWALAFAAAAWMVGDAASHIAHDAAATAPTTTTAPTTSTPPAPVLDGNRWTARPDHDAEFLALTNTYRAGVGLDELAWSDDLYGYAVDHLRRMVAQPAPTHGGLWHSDITRVFGGEVGWTDVGENLGTGGYVTDVQAALVASPGHLANIVDPEFTHMASATVDDGYRLTTVHVFGGAPRHG